MQDEFLAIHRAVGKTTLFVTHDIDEAIKMADRIAILKPGGKLAQFGAPAEVLSSPADDFVAEFLGAERGLKRLALTTVGEIVSGSGDRAGSGAETTHWPEVEATMTLREALSVVSAARAEGAVVHSGGNRLGEVNLHDLIAPPAAGEDREGVRT